MIIDVLARFPSWADNPRLYLRYNAACAAMNCADGKGSPPVSQTDRQAYRTQALALLAAELALMTKLAISDRQFVHQCFKNGSRTLTWRVCNPPGPITWRPKNENAGKNSGQGSNR